MTNSSSVSALSAALRKLPSLKSIDAREPDQSAPAEPLTIAIEPAVVPLSSAPNPGRVSNVGYLLKRSGSAGAKFQSRWFILHGRWLSYFKDSSDSKPTGSIDLSLAFIETPKPLSSIRQFQFNIVYGDKVYVLVGPDGPTADQWVRCIRQAILLFGDKDPDQLDSEQLARNLSWDLVRKGTQRGFLAKQGGSRKTWRRRYFVLVGGANPAMVYYAEKPDQTTEIVGSFALDQHASYGHPAAACTGLQCSFLIMTQNRQFLMTADSQIECQQWIDAIQAQLDIVPAA